MPPLAGRRDDRQPKIRPCPQPIRFTVETLHHNHITAPMLTDSDSHRACAEPLGPRHQGRSSSLRCGRSTLTPGPVQRCPHRGRNSSKPPLTTPCPFRDDHCWKALAERALVREMRSPGNGQRSSHFERHFSSDVPASSAICSEAVCGPDSRGSPRVRASTRRTRCRSPAARWPVRPRPPTSPTYSRRRALVG